MINPGYWDEAELRSFGWKAGDHVRVAKNCIVTAEVEIGDNVRIDPFTTIASGRLKLGSNIHIGSYCFLACAGGVTMEDFSGLSQRCSIYSVSDDYSGGAMTNPTVPPQFTNVKMAPVLLRRHVIVGSGTVILPGVEIGLGTAVGALSLVSKSLPEWSICAGQPARRIKARSQDLLAAERAYLAQSS